MLRLLFFLFFLTLCSHTPQHVERIKGEVVSIQKYNLVNKPTPYLQFILRTQGMEYTVDLGPDWYLNEQGLVLIPREEIEVTGSLVSYGNKKIIIASCIKKGDQQIKLRHDSGSPLWD